MIEKRINKTMVLMSLIGGIAGFIIGEVLLNLYKYRLPQSILVGLYFGVLALCIGIMCVIAEIINPVLNGTGWKNYYLKTSLKFLIPCTLIAVFICGTFFQFVYELSIGKIKKINDIVFVIDTSGSMSNTDPHNERFSATMDLINNMNKDNRASIYIFNDKAESILPMTEVTDKMKNDASERLNNCEKPKGSTNISDALKKAYDEIELTAQPGRNSMVILLSDGVDNNDLNAKFDEIIEPYKSNFIPVYTASMSNGNNFLVLRKISRESGGNYFNVKEVKDLKAVFNKIYRDRQQRLLIDKRNGVYESSTFYMVFRIILIALLGCLTAISISFVFDNKHLLKGFVIGGIISGVGAGLIIELGFQYFPWLGPVHRALADIIIALLFTLIPVNVDIKNYSKDTYENKKEKFYKNNNNNINSMFH